MTDLVIDVPDNEYLSANDRRHWRPERQRKIALRNRGMFLARKHRLTIPTPCTLTVTVGLRTHGRADADNSAPTVKCLIDGIVAAGALVDDSTDHITATTYRRGPRVTEKGWRTITLTFHEEKP
ncbi:Uncharacterised protein [Brevibacterium casei]|uniref:Holliday junction resolvase n=1 Tax=Brevibacterium casei TaxID=33889 RepID=A0A449D7Q3_9MICO|nr:hypothetical protein [Brevibacterium casei]VEW13526.1 Uncharacterised protein [Brevibacterium casei]